MAMSPVKLLPKIGRKNGTWYMTWGRDEFYAGGADDQRRLRRDKLARDIADLIPEHRHKMMLGDSRYIYQAFSTVSGAVDQKANYVYGGAWKLKSYSENKEFAEAVEKDFEQIDRMLDTRGRGYSFRHSVWLGSKTLDVDGDYFVILTEDPETGFPKLQYIEAHRIGSWEQHGETVVKDGKYKGLRIYSGVIVNEFMEPLAYRIKDDSKRLGFQDMPANGVIAACDMRWFSQLRGLPTISSAVLDWYDLAETRDAEKIAQKVSSALSLVESNETGKVDTGNNIVNPSPSGDGRLQTQLMDSGMIRYIKNGGSLTAHESRRPSDGWLKFTEMVESSAFYAMGWRREMLDSSKVGGAGVRGFAADINKSIQARCEVLYEVQRRLAIYVIAKRAKQGTYDLPEDWYKIGFSKPAQFTVDEGRMRAADIEDLRAGLITEDAIVEARGMDYEEMLRKRAMNLKLKREIAEEFELTETLLGTRAKPGDPEQINTTGENTDGGE